MVKKFTLASLQWLWFSIALIIILGAITVSATRLIFADLSRYEAKVTAWASEIIKQPVSIGRVHAAWHGLQPVVKLRNVTVYNQAKTKVLAHIDKLNIGVDIFDSLLSRHVMPGEFLLSGMNLDLIQQAEGQISLNGIDQMSLSQGQRRQTMAADDVLSWLITPGNKSVRHVTVHWHGQDGTDYSFTNVRADLHSGLLSHKLIARAALDNSNSNFKLILDISGNMLAKQRMHGALYLQAKEVDLAQLPKHTFRGIQLAGGVANSTLWLKWHQHQIDSVKTLVSARDLMLKRQDKTISVTPKLTANVAWDRQPEGWLLSMDKLRFGENAKQVPQQFMLHVSNDAAHSQHWKISQFSLQDIAPILLHSGVLSEANQSWLQAANPQGVVSSLDLNYDGQWQGQFDFKDIQMSSNQNHPGFQGITGHVEFKPEFGKIELGGADGHVDIPQLFAEPIFYSKLYSSAIWRRQAEGWLVEASSLRAMTHECEVNSTGKLYIPDDATSPQIEMVAGFTLANVAAAQQYLPVRIMNRELVSWLRSSLKSGRVPNGSLVLRGPLNAFPYDDHRGRFIVDSEVDDLQLAYKKNWPSLAKLHANLIFDDRAMHIKADAGEVMQQSIAKIDADIVDLATGQLIVKGTVDGDLAKGMQFINSSPLKRTIGREMNALRLRGPMSLDLDLNIPLRKSSDNIQVRGDLTINDGTLGLPMWGLATEHLVGKVSFTQDDLQAKEVSALLEDEPLHINIATLPARKSSVTKVNLSGRANVNKLLQRYGLHNLPINGATPFTGAIWLHHYKDKRPDVVKINSNLQGVSCDLPVPMQKNATEPLPLHVRIELGKKERHQFQLQLADKISAVFGLGARGVDRGHVHLGQGATLPKQQGVLVDGRLNYVNLDQWSQYLNLQKSKTTSSASLLEQVNLSFDHMILLGQPLNQAKITLKPNGVAKEWQLQSDKIAGSVTVPRDYPRSAITASIDQMVLDQPIPDSNHSLTPRDVPAFNASVREFIYHDILFGKVAISVTPERNILRINELDVDGPTMQLSATGKWRQRSSGQVTELTGAMRTQDLGVLLKQFDVNNTIVGGKGSANFTLNWHDALTQPGLDKLGGKLSLQFNDGRIEKLGKKAQSRLGIGRVLNLLSLQSLPRRLALDFSDLTHDGFVFNQMQGDFILRQGNAFTQNAKILGPVAKVAVNGRLGLDQQDYQLKLAITPKMTKSLPVVAAITGGPIAGAATWVAEKIFSKAVDNVTTINYQVVGPWTHPDVLKVKG